MSFGQFVVHKIAPVEIAISDLLIVDMVSIITSLFATNSLSAKESTREEIDQREKAKRRRGKRGEEKERKAGRGRKGRDGEIERGR